VVSIHVTVDLCGALPSIAGLCGGLAVPGPPEISLLWMPARAGRERWRSLLKGRCHQHLRKMLVKEIGGL